MCDRCFICCSTLNEPPVYLPMDDEYMGQDISIFKNTFIIKTVEPFNFLYYYVCNKCINRYLEYYGTFFKYIKNREIGINIKNRDAVNIK